MIKGTGKRLVPRKLVDWLKKLAAKYDDPDDVGAVYEHVITVDNKYIFRIHNSSGTPLTKEDLTSDYKGKYDIVYAETLSQTKVKIGLYVEIDTDVKPTYLVIDLEGVNPFVFGVDMNTTITDTVKRR